MSRASTKEVADSAIEMYGGTIRVKFAAGNHSYWISEKSKGEWTKFVRKTGVTTFIGIKDKPALVYWAVNVAVTFLEEILGARGITKYDLQEAKGKHREFVKSAASTGTKIHDWMEEYAKGMNPAIPEEESVARGVDAFLDWKKQNKVKIVEAEPLIYSKEYEYCGQIDGIIEINGKKYLLDYKTGNGLYESVMMQTAAYAKAYEEMGLGKIHGRYAVRIEKREKEAFYAEMEKKGKMDVEYQVFEHVYLDHGKDDLDDDFNAFIDCLNLRNWDGDAKKRLDEYKLK